MKNVRRLITDANCFLVGGRSAGVAHVREGKRNLRISSLCVWPTPDFRAKPTLKRRSTPGSTFHLCSLWEHTKYQGLHRSALQYHPGVIKKNLKRSTNRAQDSILEDCHLQSFSFYISTILTLDEPLCTIWSQLTLLTLYRSPGHSVLGTLFTTSSKRTFQSFFQRSLGRRRQTPGCWQCQTNLGWNSGERHHGGLTAKTAAAVWKTEQIEEVKLDVGNRHIYFVIKTSYWSKFGKL